MSRPHLVVKQSAGWFAAGWQFAEALQELSDAAFKLHTWLCLTADRLPLNGRALCRSFLRL